MLNCDSYGVKVIAIWKDIHLKRRKFRPIQLAVFGIGDKALTPVTWCHGHGESSLPHHHQKLLSHVKIQLTASDCNLVIHYYTGQIKIVINDKLL